MKSIIALLALLALFFDNGNSRLFDSACSARPVQYGLDLALVAGLHGYQRRVHVANILHDFLARAWRLLYNDRSL